VRARAPLHACWLGGDAVCDLDLAEVAEHEERARRTFRCSGHRSNAHCSNQLFAQFAEGNRSIVYPALIWVLREFNKLQTRVYLARYLSHTRCRQSSSPTLRS